MKQHNTSFLRRICATGVVLVALGCGAAHAAANYGCNDESNDRITPELALCSVHAYNLGAVTNKAEDRQLVRDVIALKTTVITQQMYKQYEYMDSMIRRFKTQLEKAVLTAKLQAAGASTDGASGAASSGGGSYSSGDRNIYMAGVQNCNNELTNLKVFECLNSNLNSIYNASNNGANITLELRKQLANDYNVAAGASKPRDAGTVTLDGKDVDCTNYKNIGQRKQFQACLDGLRAAIRNGYDAYAAAAAAAKKE